MTSTRKPSIQQLCLNLLTARQQILLASGKLHKLGKEFDILSEGITPEWLVYEIGAQAGSGGGGVYDKQTQKLIGIHISGTRSGVDKEANRTSDQTTVSLFNPWKSRRLLNSLYQRSS